MPRASRPAVATREMVRRRRRRRALVVLAVLTLAVGGTGYGAWRYIEEQEFLLEPGCMVPLGGEEHRLDPEQSAHAALIAAMAVDRELPVEAAVDALAISLQESDLRVAEAAEDQGPRGLFRDDGPDWREDEEGLQEATPVARFYDTLSDARDRSEDPWTPELTIGEAAAVLDRPLDPSIYGDHLDSARAFAPPLTGRQPLGITCTFSSQDVVAADPGGMDDAMSAALGRTLGASAEDGADEQVIRRQEDAEGAVELVVEVPDAGESSVPDPAWLVGQWSVATAEVHGVWSVRAGGYEWRRETGRWEKLEPSDDAAQGQVVVGFAPED